ncbi:hypothetical protein PTKIN_Ptkin08bG0004800 [Pterospermum kingtungense]
MAPEVATDKASFMVQAKSLGFPVSTASKRSFFMAQIILRLFAAAFTLVAICVMVTSTQTIFLFGLTMTARYSYSSAMRFLLVSDSIVCAFSALSVIFVYHLSRSGSDVKNCFYLFLHDMVIMVLTISGCAAASAVAYISKYGEAKMGWLAVCNRVEKFCNHMLIPLVLSYLAFFCYLALAVLSRKKLFMYQANECVPTQ